MAERAAHTDARQAALRLLSLIDLAAAAEARDEAAIRRLCGEARTRAGPLAAIRVDARFVPLAKNILAHSGVRVAVLAGSPDGTSEAEAAAAEAAAAVAAGADEVEVVLLRDALLAGNGETAAALLRRCRHACRRKEGGAALLKAVLETGRLGEGAAIRGAAAIAIAAGADFVKTATGRCEPGTTLPAAAALIDAIEAAHRERRWAGLAVGGIRSLAEATAYLALAERRLGAEFLGPGTFRIDGAALIGEALAALGAPHPAG